MSTVAGAFPMVLALCLVSLAIYVWAISRRLGHGSLTAGPVLTQVSSVEGLDAEPSGLAVLTTTLENVPDQTLVEVEALCRSVGLDWTTPGLTGEMAVEHLVSRLEQHLGLGQPEADGQGRMSRADD